MKGFTLLGASLLSKLSLGAKIESYTLAKIHFFFLQPGFYTMLL